MDILLRVKDEKAQSFMKILKRYDFVEAKPLNKVIQNETKAQQSTADFWHSLNDNQKDEVLRGLEEIKNGEVVSYDELMAKHR